MTVQTALPGQKEDVKKVTVAMNQLKLSQVSAFYSQVRENTLLDWGLASPAKAVKENGLYFDP